MSLAWRLSVLIPLCISLPLDIPVQQFRRGEISGHDLQQHVKEHLEYQIFRKLVNFDIESCSGPIVPDLDPRAVYYVGVNPCALSNCRVDIAPLYFVCQHQIHARNLLAQRMIPNELVQKYPQNISAVVQSEDALSSYFVSEWLHARLQETKEHLNTPLQRHIPTKRFVEWCGIYDSVCNMVDGSWAPSPLGVPTKLANALFKIKLEEIGEGRLEWNHPLEWKKLVEGYNGPVLDDIHHISYIALLPAQAYENAALSVGVQAFPRSWELMVAGFALNLELLAPPWYLQRARQQAAYGIDPTFYNLHVGIDNIVTGHSHLILQAIAEQVLQLPDPVVGFQSVYLGFSMFETTSPNCSNTPVEEWGDWSMPDRLTSSPPTGTQLCSGRPPLPTTTGQDSNNTEWTWDQVATFQLVVIRDSVFDLCGWLPDHPGFGLSAWFGKDGTQPFTVLHSHNWNLAQKWKVGHIARSAGGVNKQPIEQLQLHDTSSPKSAVNKTNQAILDMADMLIPFLTKVPQIYHSEKCGMFKLLSKYSDTMDDALALTHELGESEFVNREFPRKSRIWELMQYGQPMFKVFNYHTVWSWLDYLHETRP